MPPNRRKYNEEVVTAELAGRRSYMGRPCAREEKHIEDGKTERDTVTRYCVRCPQKPERRTLNVSLDK